MPRDPVQIQEDIQGDQRTAFSTCMIMRGVVESNNDPYRTGRVQVRIPCLHGVPDVTPTAIPSTDLPWAPICSLSAGHGRGTVLTPMIGDTVFVGFEDGRKDKPIVLGSCYSSGTGEGKQFTGSTSKMFKDQNGKTSLSTSMSNIPDAAREGDCNQVLYKSVKGAAFECHDADGCESIRMIDRVGQIIEMGTDCPSGTRTRTDGDRSRKNQMPKDAFYEKGYIHLHSASTHGKDSGLHMTEDTVMCVNGTSLLNMDTDHITLTNVGGEYLTTKNRPEPQTNESGAEVQNTFSALDEESKGKIADAATSAVAQAAMAKASLASTSSVTSQLASLNTVANMGSASNVTQLGSRLSAIDANIAGATKGLDVIQGCFGGIGSIGSATDILSTVSGITGAMVDMSQVTNALSKITSCMDNLSALVSGISSIGNLGSLGSLVVGGGFGGALGNITGGTLSNLGSISGVSGLSSNFASVSGNLGGISSSAGIVTGSLSGTGCMIDIVGDQITIKNSGCSITMVGGDMMIQATGSITMIAPRIMLNY